MAAHDVYDNPFSLTMLTDHEVDVTVFAEERKFTFDIAGEGRVDFAAGAYEESFCKGCTDLGVTKDLPSTRTPSGKLPSEFSLTAEPADGYVFAGWSGDRHIDGMMDPEITVSALDGWSFITARFAQCDAPFTAFSLDLTAESKGGPPTGWTQVGDGGIVVWEDAPGSPRYLTEMSDQGVGAYIERRQESPDTDITFAYRFATFAIDNQEIRVHSRLTDDGHHNTLRIKPNKMVLAKTSGSNVASVPANFYSEPGVWYNVFMRTIGTNMYVWVQKADEAVAWDQAIHSQAPLLFNTDTDADTATTTTFRVNILPLGYNNFGALQIRDIEVQTWPCGTANTQYPDISEYECPTLQVSDTEIDFDAPPPEI